MNVYLFHSFLYSQLSLYTIAMIFQDVQDMDVLGTWHSTFKNLNTQAKENAGTQKYGKSIENRNFNRYRDVLPYDHSLVRLRNSDTEYINANLVKVSSIGKEYILTQGPLSNTCKHFWEMVWEQNSHSIVMLNRVIEKNQPKCHQYWPLKGSLTAGNIKISLLKEDNHSEFIVRVLEIEHLQENAKRNIRHFHYVAWPDFGVPSSPQAFLNYLLKVQEYQSSVDGIGPPVVHCSAGIGRSGTFVLIDAALTEIQEKDDMMNYDVKNKLLEIRTFRPGLIQTTEQLHFSYVAILEGANMVAPSAYSRAYYSMDEEVENVDEDKDEDENVARDDVVAPKRPGDEQKGDEPEAKELRQDTESDSEDDDQKEEEVNSPDENTKPNDKVLEENHCEADAEKQESKQEHQDDMRMSQNTQSVYTETIGGKSENSGLPDVVPGTHDDVSIARNESSDSKQPDPTETTGSEPIKMSDYGDEGVEESGDDKILEQVTNIESVGGVSSVCSGRFPSDFNMRSFDDIFGKDDAPRSCESAETVVDRWQSPQESSQSLTETPAKPRSAMRRNSLEGNKRKSVTFVATTTNGAGEGTGEENGEMENLVNMDNAGYVEEKETEGSQLRRRETGERQRNLANKVDEIKKKMKKSEKSYSPAILGLVVCAVVVGFAYFYYYRSQS